MKDTLVRAAKAAGDIIRDNISKSFTVSNKEGVNNLVTEIDHKSERAIIAIIQEDFPDHQVLSEECGAMDTSSEYKWIIDPIDGTVNFAHGIPICAVSIGIEKAGKMHMAAVYNPFMNEFYFAERGKGAYLNDQPISVSKVNSVMNACLVTGFPYTYLDSPNGPLQVFERFIRRGIPVRRLGSAAIDLCWVAAGRFDGFFEHKLAAWDSAAGFLLVEEAGGRVTDLSNNPYNPYQPGIIATNGMLHDELYEWVSGRVPENQ